MSLTKWILKQHTVHSGVTVSKTVSKIPPLIAAVHVFSLYLKTKRESETIYKQSAAHFRSAEGLRADQSATGDAMPHLQSTISVGLIKGP